MKGKGCLENLVLSFNIKAYRYYPEDTIFRITQRLDENEFFQSSLTTKDNAS
jgi:hypothetical protein